MIVKCALSAVPNEHNLSLIYISISILSSKSSTSCWYNILLRCRLTRRPYALHLSDMLILLRLENRKDYYYYYYYYYYYILHIKMQHKNIHPSYNIQVKQTKGRNAIGDK